MKNKRMTTGILVCLCASLGFGGIQKLAAANPPPLLNEPVDISGDFHNFANLYYLADKLASFDPATGQGKITYQRSARFTRVAFDNMLAILKPAASTEFPADEYAANPTLPFSINFVSARTIRIQVQTGPDYAPRQPELMLDGPVPKDTHDWKYSKVPGGYRYTGPYGSVTLKKNPWGIEIRNAHGKLLTRTVTPADLPETYTPILPFCFVRRASDYSRSVDAAFTLSPGEKIFGCGESFTAFNKRGQKIVLWANDANGIENRRMYKPIPFFMSSRGYGMFMHTSTPITCDFGRHFSGVNSLMIGADKLDLFVFLGAPREILNQYTDLTGKPPLPPLWSFGLWMSRCTYTSETQVEDVAAKLRQYKIPCDVIHIDTGWFETDWRCDYQFSPSRFPTPQQMIDQLKREGFRISLWQLPYFVPKNTLFPEIIKKGLFVRDGQGDSPREDAILDFSNPATVKWYQAHLAPLLKMGVGAIKVDFGEAAPLDGLYADGRTGFYEHNLYPLRYNKAVADITAKITGQHLIWARSTWAGSQRYPIHWGGDAESTDDGMAAELRGGLSFGLSGFSFWSHDVGGFVSRPSNDLYARWLAFGVLCSHTRCHGTAPKEPWHYGPAFVKEFRRIDDLKYELMPYVYAQARDCSEHGLPMVRALFVEYPNDPGSWLVDNEYLFGSSILAAPLFHENATGRSVYLPPGTWIDYQTGKAYNGGWHHIQAGPIPIVMLVRDGTVIPRIALAQSTMQMDWSKLQLEVFARNAQTAKGLVCLPADNGLHELTLKKEGNTFKLENNPLAGKVTWKIVQGTYAE